jgi:hypothetical protein
MGCAIFERLENHGLTKPAMSGHVIRIVFGDGFG